MKNLKVVIFTVVGFIVAFIAGSFIYEKSMSSKLDSISGADGAPFVREHSPKFGKNGKNVTVVEILDPECGACAVFYPVVEKILDDYGDDIELVIRYMPNHTNSKDVIKILEASRMQGKYKETLDIIFDSQQTWGKYGDPKPDLIWDYVKLIDGLDIEKLKIDMEDEKILKIINIDTEDVNKLGVTGTPTFFVNKKKLEKLSYKDLDELVRSEISKTK